MEITIGLIAVAAILAVGLAGIITFVVVATMRGSGAIVGTSSSAVHPLVHEQGIRAHQQVQQLNEQMTQQVLNTQQIVNQLPPTPPPSA